MIALVGSLVASLVCLGLLETLVKQVRLMVPYSATPAEREAVRESHNAWQSDPQIRNTIAYLSELQSDKPTKADVAAWSSTIRDNSLPLWAELLIHLRESGIEPAWPGSAQPVEVEVQPANDQAILRVLRSLDYAAPLRIGVGPLRARLIAAARDRGVSARTAEAVFWADRWSSVLAAYRPVLRELAGRLCALGRHWQQAGRSADATRAYKAAIRALTDAANDSPLPEVALLAASELEPILRELEALEPGGPAEAAENLMAFRRAWMDVSDDEMAMLPATFGPALAGDDHAGVLASITAAAGLVGYGWILAVLCLLLLAVIGATRPFGEVALTWRWGGWGAVVAPALVTVPLISIVLVVSSEAVPWIWLVSSPSLSPIIVLAPGTLLLLWIAATHLCLQPTGSASQAGLPWFAVVGGLAVVLVVGAVTVMLPFPSEAWQPPVGVQVLRRSGTVVGALSLALSLAGVVWAWRRRRGADLPAGVWSRGGLAVASAAMLVMLTAASIALVVNHRRDAQHETAFARRVTDPIAARLGPDWWDTHFSQTVSVGQGRVRPGDG